MDVTCVRPHELEPMKVAMHGATDEVRFAAALFEEVAGEARVILVERRSQLEAGTEEDGIFVQLVAEYVDLGEIAAIADPVDRELELVREAQARMLVEHQP